MKRKVKKFGRGGDILTGIGAGLAGYGIYKALTKGKEQDDEYTKKVKEYGTKGRYPEEKPEEKAQDSSKAAERKADERKAKNESSYAPENKFDVAKQTGFTGDGKDDKTKPLPTVIKKKKDGPKTEPPSKPYPKVTRNFVPNEERASIPYPEKEAAARKEAQAEADAKKAAVERRKGQGLTPYAPYTGPGSSSHAQMLRESRDPEMVKRRREESERKEREAAKKRKGVADIQYDTMGNVINKRGGVIKKYASGGSVKTAKPTMRSASSRADGIAIRGKTRA